MRVKILGSAAGGAFPQWNCGCPNCRALRAGSFRGKARSQAQVAVSNDGKSWFLLGASPDLRAQIEATPELHPQDGVRQSPIAGVVLANADVDHVLGLLLLRELQPLSVYATDSVRRIVTEDNSMFAMLQRVPGQVAWSNVTPRAVFPLHTAAGADSGLRCRALSLSPHFPAYVSPQRQGELSAEEASLGLIVESKIVESKIVESKIVESLISETKFASASAGKRLAYVPAAPQIDDALLKEFECADLLLFDGTFWSDDELIRTQGSGRGGQTARQMGHVPVSSSDGSLGRLAGLSHPRKIYVHINNTNPMLNEAGPEYREVREAGWEIAEDGWQFDL